VASLEKAREQLVGAAHTLSRLGLVTAFGHVSVRVADSMLITPATDLATVTAGGLIHVELNATTLPSGAPAESWLHVAVYRARADAAALARAQPPSAFAVTAVTTTLKPLHGQAAWLGESVPVHDSAHLLRSIELAEAAAHSLDGGEALLLRGNGALTLGPTPGIAVARMWLLAAACDVWLSARSAGDAHPLTPEEVTSWRAVADELLPRLWRSLETGTTEIGASNVESGRASA
jgi:HCOMODA/2-hydroxy-3-carboxy-muconic semialdehyde decarboxylase